MSDEETSHLVAKSEHPVISTESSVGNPATSRFSLLRLAKTALFSLRGLL
jgi:hypothetical protein